jgi:perosamine synthetase
MRIINYLWGNLNRAFFHKNYWGFVKGHDYLSTEDGNEFANLISNPDNRIRNQYEREFASYLGLGKCLSYATGRMAFYTLLKCFEIKDGDEVILTGFTCSVMVNAVIRTGATPVYTDIDSETYGSSPDDIRKKITGKTKVIVAQHSFGISCKIDLIKQIADDNGLFLIEDCALSFTSTYKGVTLGNWGHAAIFSTDHSKPLNTLTGGMLYTLDDSLFRKAEELYDEVAELSIKHQSNILNQIWTERKYCNSRNYSVYKLLFFLNLIKRRFFKGETTFLSDDNYATVRSSGAYPYPSRMPVFLCRLGLMELARFNASKIQRVKVLKKYLDIFLNTGDNKFMIPNCYFDPDNDIVPLRFVFESFDPDFEDRLSDFIDTSWIWFKKPIVATTDQLSDFGYEQGSCSISEFTGSKIINLPCIFENEEILIKLKSIMPA